MRKIKNSFLNDDDGFSSKDFLMVVVITLFCLFLAVAFFAPFFGYTVSLVSLGVIENMNYVVMTIIGGIFGVQAVREIKAPTESNKTNTSIIVKSNAVPEEVIPSPEKTTDIDPNTL